MSESSPVERALDVVVYAPLGVAMFARDALPGIAGMLVARGRSEIDNRRRHVSQQVAQAKTIGRFAVRFGGPEVKRRVEGGVATARAAAETTLGTLAATHGPGTGAHPEPEPKRAPAAAATNGHRSFGSTNGPSATTASTPNEPTTDPPAPPVSALAIPEYDELSASQVVGRLDGLVDADLETVHAYESAHRNRRTILGKIAQLRK